MTRRSLQSCRAFRGVETAEGVGRYSMPETLSMGMSGDFEVAIEEGATIVRIGSALWEGLA